MTTSPVISVTDLTKMYVTDEVETHALTGVNLRIDAGEYVAIMGPSGCGKTTLMSILGLLDTPTSGAYDLAGTPVARLDARQRAHFRNRNIGFVFQSFNLIGDLSVYENVELPLTYRGGVERAERRRKVIEALESVGMSHRMRHFPAQLSGGQQQRVAIARALAMAPQVMFFDEATSALDPELVKGILALIADLGADGMTMVVVTHEMGFAREVANQLVFMDGGVVVESGPPRDVLSNPQHERTKAFLSKVL